MNEDQRCVRCGHPIPAAMVGSGAADGLIAGMARAIECLRQTVARLRGSGGGRSLVAERRRWDTS